MTPASSPGPEVARIRRAFEETLARALAAPPIAFEDLLAVRIGGEPYVLRLRELSGLSTGRKIVPVPTQRFGILGLAGVRGDLVAVYSLGVLLGLPGGAPGGRRPWLALAAANPTGASQVALAFDLFERQVRVPRVDIVAARPPGPHAEMAVRIDGALRLVVNLPSALKRLAERSEG